MKISLLAFMLVPAACGERKPDAASNPAVSDTIVAQQTEVGVIQLPDTLKSVVVSSVGAKIDLTGTLSLDIEASAEAETQNVTVTLLRSQELIEEFEEGTAMRILVRPDWIAHISLDKMCPKQPVEVTAAVAPALRAAGRVVPFAQIYHASETEILDQFEIVKAELSADSASIRFTVPAEAFTVERSAGGKCDAFVTVASVQ